jgi:hypothetical protein
MKFDLSKDSAGEIAALADDAQTPGGPADPVRDHA